MAKKKHPNFNEPPQFFTTDINGACIIFKLTTTIQSMTCFECMYKAEKSIIYDGVDAVVQDPTGSNAKTFFITIRTGTILPEYYNDGTTEFELTWYDRIDVNGDEINLDEILTMCVL